MTLSSQPVFTEKIKMFGAMQFQDTVQYGQPLAACRQKATVAEAAKPKHKFTYICK